MSAPNTTRDQGRGFTQLAAGLAVLMSMAALLGVAFKLDKSNGEQTAIAATRSATGGGASAAGGEDVKLVVKSDEEHGKKGSDGNWHDAYLPADFSVNAGATVHVTVYNYDDMPHSFTATEIGVNQEIAAGSEGKPSKTTFTFTAPAQAGSYEWFCDMPCDPWAMSHEGFMRGHVRVT